MMTKVIDIQEFAIKTRNKSYKVKVKKDVFSIDDHWQTWLR